MECINFGQLNQKSGFWKSQLSSIKHDDREMHYLHRQMLNGTFMVLNQTINIIPSAIWWTQPSSNELDTLLFSTATLVQMQWKTHKGSGTLFFFFLSLESKWKILLKLYSFNANILRKNLCLSPWWYIRSLHSVSISILSSWNRPWRKMDLLCCTICCSQQQKLQRTFYHLWQIKYMLSSSD